MVNILLNLLPVVAGFDIGIYLSGECSVEYIVARNSPYEINPMPIERSDKNRKDILMTTQNKLLFNLQSGKKRNVPMYNYIYKRSSALNVRECLWYTF